MEYKHIVMGACLALTGTANASTIFAPTDGDVNTYDFSITSTNIDDSIYDLYIFDDGISNFVISDNQGDSLNVPMPSIVGFSGPTGSGNYIATNENSETLTLTGSNHFIFAVTDGSQWYADTGYLAVGANSYDVYFGAIGGVFNADLIFVDQRTDPAAVVPVPAAVWLFGSGLLGLAGIARRRRQ